VLFEIAAVGKATMKTAVPKTKEQKPRGLMINKSPMIFTASGRSFANAPVDVKTITKASITIIIFFMVFSF